MFKKFAAAAAAATIVAQPAGAFGDYRPHERPFHYIGSRYSQGNGDAICRQIFARKGGYRTGGGIGWNRDGINGGVGAGGNVIYAHDGSVINRANHVWYHQRNGECVANI
jgi:hypothetical protein